VFQFPPEDIWLDDEDAPGASRFGAPGFLSARGGEGPEIGFAADDLPLPIHQDVDQPPVPPVPEPGAGFGAIDLVPEPPRAKPPSDSESRPGPEAAHPKSRFDALEIELGFEDDSPFARDDNDVLVRREKETRERFDTRVTVTIDGYPIDVPRAVPKRDAQGNALRDADGQQIPRVTTIYDAATELVARGVWTEEELKSRIPTLCHLPHATPVAVCRMCSVQISSLKRGKLTVGRKLVPACQHRVEANMLVATRAGLEGYNPGQKAKLSESDQRILQARADTVNRAVTLLTELFVTDCRRDPLTAAKRYDDELSAVARSLGVITGAAGAEEVRVRPGLRRLRERPSRNAAEQAVPASRRVPLPLIPTPTEHSEERPDRRNAWEQWNASVDKAYPYSSRTVVVDHDRCIACDRCVRACSEVKPFKVIGHTGKGYGTRISFDLDAVMRDSSCVQCGECMNSCPTGALSLRRRARADASLDIPVNPNAPFPEGTGFLTADEMRQVWLRYESPARGPVVVFPFRSIPYSYLKWNEGAVRRLEIAPGAREALCREGEHSSTAFLLQGTGTLEVYARGPEPAARPGLFGRVFGGSTPKAPESGYGRLLRVSACDELILGETTCLDQRPWDATVVAVAPPNNPELTLGFDQNGRPAGVKSPNRHGPMVVYEIARNLLEMIQRSAALREYIEEVYALRAIQAGVNRSKLLAGLGAEDRASARTFLLTHEVDGRKAEFRRAAAGETIVVEGDTAASFFILRSGNVRVFTTTGTGERVLRVLSAGDSFGEDGVLSDGPGVRTASVSALDRVELVRVPGPVFRRLCDKFPELKEGLAAARRPAVPGVSGVPSPEILSEYVRQGLYQAQNLLAIDLKSCTRCDECTKACAESHDGHSRLLLDGLRVGDFLVATSCRSCHKPYCVEGCPVDAIHRRGPRMEVVVENHCIGCGLCERNCPYGAIHMVPRSVPHPDAAGHAEGDPTRTAARRAVNCDLCGGDEPYCVYACPHDSAHRLSGPALLDAVLRQLPNGR
jgi:Fe-S-cluster-containing hydrogenase component 2